MTKADFCNETRSSYNRGCRCAACREACAAYQRGLRATGPRTDRSNPEQTNTAWMARAACKSDTVGSWEPPGPGRKYWSPRFLYALGMCMDICPVQEQCIEFALSDGVPNDDHMMYGGLRPTQRRQIKKGTADLDDVLASMRDVLLRRSDAA